MIIFKLRVIDLNLALDDNFYSNQSKLTLCEENLEFLALKIRYLELKNDKFISEKNNLENEQEMNVLTKNKIIAKQSLNENFSVFKKNMELMLIEDELDKKRLLLKKINSATEQLYSFSEKKNIESVETNELDSFIKYKYTNECEINDQKLNTPKLADYLEYFESKSKYENAKLDNILDGHALKNEVDLLKYQNTNEFSLSNVLSINDAINQELLNMIVLNSQSYQYETNKNKNDHNYEIIFKILKKNRIRKYYRDYLGLYGRYFKSNITLKKKLCEFNQLYSIFEQLKSEKDFYRESFLVITKRFDRIKNMELQIHEKQIAIEDILNENFIFFNQKFQLDFDKIRISWEQLIDIFRNLISSNAFINTLKIDFPNEPRHNKIDQYKLSIFQLLSNDESKNDDFEKRFKLVKEILSLKNTGKAKSFIISIFIELFLDITSKIKTINKINEQRITTRDIENSFEDLKNSLDNCKEADKNQISAFFGLFVEKIQFCEHNSNLIVEVNTIFKEGI